MMEKIKKLLGEQPLAPHVAEPALGAGVGGAGAAAELGRRQRLARPGPVGADQVSQGDIGVAVGLILAVLAGRHPA